MEQFERQAYTRAAEKQMRIVKKSRHHLFLLSVYRQTTEKKRRRDRE